MKETLNIICGCAGVVAAFLWGSLDGTIIALVTFVILDYITGVIQAVYNKNLSSEIGFRGILKKIVLFLIVAVANILDTQVLKAGAILRTAVIFIFIANEGVSLLENAAKMGIPIPKKLIDVLEQLKKKDEE